jgi:pimeloyl-ACP methyl ester carboxylesterase
MAAERVLYLPGAGGEGRFWQPVASLVAHPGDCVLFDWPGFGSNAPRPDVASADDLYRLVCGYIDRPTDIVSQSMGGLFGLRAALDFPDVVRHLVLVATSGGVRAVREAADVDWRPGFSADYPQAPAWAVNDETDLTPRLGELRVPTLLLWGDADPISPPTAGRLLQHLLPHAELHVIPGGDHAFGRDRAAVVAPLIERFLLA